MSSWSYSTPPVWAPSAIATPGGWANPLTGEILVAIRSLVGRVGDVSSKVTFLGSLLSPASLTVGDKLVIGLTPSEAVIVTGSLYIPVTVGGVAGSKAVYVGTVGGVLTFEMVTTQASAAGDIVAGAVIEGSGSIADALDAGGQSPVAVDDLVFGAVDTSSVAVVATAPAP